jgi:lantibiotic modifying enzyme
VTEQETVTVTPDTAEERPFEHLLAPIVAYASTRCDRSTVSKRLSKEAWNDLKNMLQKRLEAFCAHPLFIEFKTFVAQREPSLVFEDTPPPEQPRHFYAMFIDAMSNGTLKQFFLEYAFLARLVGTIIDQWCAVVDDFSGRLATDYDRLNATFGDGSPLGSVTAVESLGEPHHRGRRVYQLTFESETTIAYKPRPMAVEVAFSDILTWINTTSDLPHLRTPTYLSRGEYG